LRGHIVERVVTRRESRSREQANAIASDHTAAIIRHDLDERIDASVAAVQKTLRSQVPELDFDLESMPSLVPWIRDIWASSTGGSCFASHRHSERDQFTQMTARRRILT